MSVNGIDKYSFLTLYPEYAEWDEEDLTAAVHERAFSDMPYEQFHDAFLNKGPKEFTLIDTLIATGAVGTPGFMESVAAMMELGGATLESAHPIDTMVKHLRDPEGVLKGTFLEVEHKGFFDGIADTVEDLSARFLPDEGIHDLGRDIRESTGEQADMWEAMMLRNIEKYAPPEVLVNPIDNPGVLLNQNWWLFNVGTVGINFVLPILAGSVFMGPAGTAATAGTRMTALAARAKAAGQMGQAAKYASTAARARNAATALNVAARAAMFSSIGGPMGGLAFRESVKKGKPVDQAMEDGVSVAFVSGLLNTLALESMFIKGAKGLPGRLRKAGLAGTAETVTENMEEAFTSYKIDGNLDDFIRKAAMITPISFLVGGLGGMALGGRFGVSEYVKKKTQLYEQLSDKGFSKFRAKQILDVIDKGDIDRAETMLAEYEYRIDSDNSDIIRERVLKQFAPKVATRAKEDAKEFVDKILGSEPTVEQTLEGKPVVVEGGVQEEVTPILEEVSKEQEAFLTKRGTVKRKIRKAAEVEKATTETQAMLDEIEELRAIAEGKKPAPKVTAKKAPVKEEAKPAEVAVDAEGNVKSGKAVASVDTTGKEVQVLNVYFPEGSIDDAGKVVDSIQEAAVGKDVLVESEPDHVSIWKDKGFEVVQESDLIPGGQVMRWKGTEVKAEPTPKVEEKVEPDEAAEIAEVVALAAQAKESGVDPAHIDSIVSSALKKGKYSMVKKVLNNMVTKEVKAKEPTKAKKEAKPKKDIAAKIVEAIEKADPKPPDPTTVQMVEGRDTQLLNYFSVKGLTGDAAIRKIKSLSEEVRNKIHSDLINGVYGEDVLAEVHAVERAATGMKQSGYDELLDTVEEEEYVEESYEEFDESGDTEGDLLDAAEEVERGYQLESPVSRFEGGKPVYFDRVIKAINAMDIDGDKQVNPGAFANEVKKSGMQKWYLDHTGVTAWLDGMKPVKVSKNEVLAFLRGGGLSIETNVLTGTDTQYSGYSILGLDSYREILLSIHGKIKGYVSPHFLRTDIANMFAHIRGGLHGKSDSFIVDEIQSDWASGIKAKKDKIPWMPFSDSYIKMAIQASVRAATESGMNNVQFITARTHINRWDAKTDMKRAKGLLANYGETEAYIKENFSDNPELLKYAIDIPGGQAKGPNTVRKFAKQRGIEVKVGEYKVEGDVESTNVVLNLRVPGVWDDTRFGYTVKKVKKGDPMAIAWDSSTTALKRLEIKSTSDGYIVYDEDDITTVNIVFDTLEQARVSIQDVVMRNNIADVNTPTISMTLNEKSKLESIETGYSFNQQQVYSVDDIQVKNSKDVSAKELLGRIKKANVPPTGHPDAKMVGISHDVKVNKEEPAFLVGLIIKSLNEFGEMAQLFRDRKVETFRAAIMVNDVVVDHFTFSSNLLSTILVTPEHVDNLIESLYQNNATSFYITHNHPEGTPTPSDTDISSTVKVFSKHIIDKMIDVHGMPVDFNGHVVTNEKIYTVINGRGKVTEHSIEGKDILPKTLDINPIAHDLLGKQILDAGALHQAVQFLKGKDVITNFFLDDKVRIRGIIETPVEWLDDIDMYDGFLQSWQQRYGLSRSHIVTPDGLNSERNYGVAELYKRNTLEGLHRQGLPSIWHAPPKVNGKYLHASVWPRWMKKRFFIDPDAPAKELMATEAEMDMSKLKPSTELRQDVIYPSHSKKVSRVKIRTLTTLAEKKMGLGVDFKTFRETVLTRWPSVPMKEVRFAWEKAIGNRDKRKKFNAAIEADTKRPHEKAIKFVGKGKGGVTKVRTRASYVTNAVLSALRKSTIDLPNKLLDIWRNPEYMFEEMDTLNKTNIWKTLLYEAGAAEKYLKVELDSIFNKMQELTKGLDEKILGIYATIQDTPEMKKFLKEKGFDVDAIQGMEQTEKDKYIKAYRVGRNHFSEALTSVNKTREQIGLTPIHKRLNYFTFVRMDEYLNADGTDLLRATAHQIDKAINSVEAVVKGRIHPDAPLFPYKIRGKELSSTDLMYNRVFATYMNRAKRYQHLAPVIFKAREMTGTFHVGVDNNGQPIPFNIKDTGLVHMRSTVERWADFILGVANPDETFSSVRNPTLNKAIDFLTSNLSAATMTYNTRSAGIQPSALIITSTAIGTEWTKQGIKLAFVKDMRDMAVKKSNHLAVAKPDVQFDTVSDMASGGLVRRSWHYFNKYGWALLQILDYEARMAGWLGAYHKAKATSSMSDTDAVNFADSIVRKTQGAHSKAFRAAIQRTPLGKMVTLFQTFAIAETNFMVQEVLFRKNITDHQGNLLTTEAAKKEQVRRVVTWLALAALANILYEDVIGLESPLPSPMRATMDAFHNDENMFRKAYAPFGEIGGQLPAVGGIFKFGSGAGGPVLDTLGDVSRVLADKKGPKQPVWKLAGKIGGVPMTNQLAKSLRAYDADQGSWDIFWGAYSEHQRYMLDLMVNGELDL